MGLNPIGLKPLLHRLLDPRSASMLARTELCASRPGEVGLVSRAVQAGLCKPSYAVGLWNRDPR